MKTSVSLGVKFFAMVFAWCLPGGGGGFADDGLRRAGRVWQSCMARETSVSVWISGFIPGQRRARNQHIQHRALLTARPASGAWKR